MNIEYMISLIPLFGEAALMTLALTGLGVLFSFIIGVLANLVYYYRISVLTQIMKGYTELSRNTPLLAHLFFLFFGLPAIGINISGFASAVIALTFLGGSYMAEAIRGGVEAVSKSQRETADSLGLSKNQVLVYVVAPQAFRAAFAPLVANVIFLLRESSLIGAIAVPELMHIALNHISLFFRTDEVLIMLVAYYVLLIGPLSLIFHFVERRLRYGRA